MHLAAPAEEGPAPTPHDAEERAQLLAAIPDLMAGRVAHTGETAPKDAPK
jgi:hypothetical protein